MKYTPGPWKTVNRGRYVQAPRRLRTDQHDIDICHVFSAETWASEQKANAALLAAAPELLETLQELVARCDGAEGVRADGSNIQTMQAHELLARLDEHLGDQTDDTLR